MSIWYIIPSEKLMLDDKLDFFVMSNNRRLKIKTTSKLTYIQIANIKGFDLRQTFSPFRYIEFVDILTIKDFKKIYWTMSELNFDFYIENDIIEKNNCNQSLINEYNYFTGLYLIVLQKSVKFPFEICPYVFKNVFFQSLAVYELSNSELSKNLIQFNSLPIEKNINSLIATFIIFGYQIDVNEKLLNRHVFRELKFFSFFGKLNFIEEGVFKDFDILIAIYISNEFISSVFHKNPKWLYSLNQKSLIDPANFVPSIEKLNFLALVFQQSMPKLVFYEFPDEDICIFEKFPHKHGVLPRFYPAMFKCSCTFLYLIQYSFKYTDFLNDILLVTPNKIDGFYLNPKLPSFLVVSEYDCVDDSIKEKIRACNFTQRFTKCKIKEDKTKGFYFNIGYFYIADLVYSTKSMNIIINFYILPILCIVCILVNSTVILVLRRNKLEDKFYKYHKITFSFNSILCFIIPFQLLSFCIFPNGNYCSFFYKSIYSQYFYIIFTKLIGNTIKTCSYWSNVSFSLRRFIEISSSKGKYLNKIDKLSIKNYVCFSLILSFLINLSNDFEFSPHEFSILDKAKTYGFYQYPFYSSSRYFINDYLTQRDGIANITLYVFHIIKILFSDILFIVFNFIIDVKLYLFLKKSDLKKLELTNASNNNQLTYKQQKIKIAKNRLSKVSKNKIKANIYLNFINFFFLKFPLVVFSLLQFIFSYDTNALQKSNENSRLFITLCSYYKLCESFSSLSLVLLLLSFLFQFYILVKLDRNFSLENIKKTILS